MMFIPWDKEVRVHRDGRKLCMHGQNPPGAEAWLSGQVCQAWLPLFWRWVLLRRCLSLLCKWTSAVPVPPALQTCPEISEPWLWLNLASCQLYLETKKPYWTAYINQIDTWLTQQVELTSLLTSGITWGSSSFLLPAPRQGKKTRVAPIQVHFF